MGIPFTLEASPHDLWEVLVQRVDKKIEKWVTRRLTLVEKFQICTKVFVATYVY
jgi:hypothetical protein